MATPRHLLVAVAVAVLVLGCGPTASSSPSAEPPVETTAPIPPWPTASDIAVSPSLLPSEGVWAAIDGQVSTPSLANRLPLVVSIDDSRAARPQSGFNATSMVWQAPADGYESRYLFVFQELDATSIGPVRSARIYLAHWAAEVDGALAHYGGDRLTRAWMATNAGTLFTDVDGLGAGNPAFHRTSRPAPHDAYTSTAALWRTATELGAATTMSAAVHIRPFRDDAPVDQRGTSQAIRIPYNTVTVGYTFDPSIDAYHRFLDGSAQIDAMDNQPVLARTVVVLYMPFHTDSTIEAGHNRPVLGFVGTGRAQVFSEGHEIDATWSKPDELDPTVILAADGSEIPFVRGRIFFQVVPTGTDVSA